MRVRPFVCRLNPRPRPLRAGWPSAGLRFDQHIDVDEMYRKLIAASESSKGGFEVYKHETMPDRFHFTGNEVRSLPCRPLAQSLTSYGSELRPSTSYLTSAGPSRATTTFTSRWTATTRPRCVPPAVRGASLTPNPKGNHGYDPADPTMHAIFVAHGPFASTLKAGLRKRADFEERADGVTVIPGFANLEIYNLVARLLAIESPAPNNGTRGFWERFLE